MTEIELHKKSFQELTTDELNELLRVRSEVFVVEQVDGQQRIAKMQLTMQIDVTHTHGHDRQPSYRPAIEAMRRAFERKDVWTEEERIEHHIRSGEPPLREFDDVLRQGLPPDDDTYQTQREKNSSVIVADVHLIVYSIQNFPIRWSPLSDMLAIVIVKILTVWRWALADIDLIWGSGGQCKEGNKQDKKLREEFHTI